MQDHEVFSEVTGGRLVFTAAKETVMRPITPELVIEAAEKSIGSVDYCFLITLGESGQPHARLVQPFEAEPHLTIWVGTWAESRKVGEIQKDSRVALAFYDEKDTAYVTLLGSAQVESDIKKRRKYWREDWIGFLPKGPEGDDYVLIKFVPSRIELMSFGRGILPRPFGLRPAVLVRSGDSWALADNG
jgi:general stress protein 26